MKALFELLTKLRSNRLFLAALILSALAFVSYRMFAQWAEVLSYRWKFNGWYLALSFAVLLLSQGANALVWKMILGLLGEEISLSRCLFAHGLSHLARYAPPKGAGYVILVEMFKNAGISRRNGIVAVALNISFLLVSSMIVFLLSLGFFESGELMSRLKVFWVLVPFGFLIVHPRLLFPAINLGLRLIGKKSMRISYSYRSALAVMLLFITILFGQGLGLWLLLRSFYENGIGVISMTGIFSVSFAAGFIAIFSPSGLVVREGVMISLLKLQMPLEVAMAFAVLSRAVLTLVEFLTAVVAWKATKRVGCRE
jgi:uncharacterized membrane protein YbhN (UPF0104 family)